MGEIKPTNLFSVNNMPASKNAAEKQQPEKIENISLNKTDIISLSSNNQKPKITVLIRNAGDIEFKHASNPDIEAPDKITTEIKYNKEGIETDYKTIRYCRKKPVIKVEDHWDGKNWKNSIYLFPEAESSVLDNPVWPGNNRLENFLNDPEQKKILFEGDEKLKKATREEQLKLDAEHTAVTGLLDKRYGGRHNLSIVEIGPYCSTWVPRTLIKEGNGNFYSALDISKAGLDKQREFLAKEGEYMVAHTKQVWGDLYNMPFESSSADLVVTSACFPLCASKEDTIDAIDETARVLKTGGEFVLDAGSVELAVPAAVSHLLKKFDVIDSEGGGPGRILVLRKK